MAETTHALPVPTWRLRATPTVVLGVAIACALLLALPGQTAVTKYVNDLLIFLDGAYRVVWGQVPNRDFHSALGPLAYYIPGAGYFLTGSLGAAMPVGTALVILLIAPAMAYLLDSRLTPALAIPLGVVLILILAVPINLGEPVTALSFGMFYNRIGWAVLALLLVMYLPPREVRPAQVPLDAAVAVSLTAFLIYLKVSYGLIALGFLVFMVVVSPQRRWAALAIVGTVAAALVVEAFWRSHAAYWADLRLAADVSGAFRGTWPDRVRLFLGNLPDYLFFGLLAGLALWRTRSLRDALFFGFCAAAGYVVMNQNFQGLTMVTLFAGGAVAAEMLVRGSAVRSPAPVWGLGTAACLLLVAFVLPTSVSSATALALHATMAARGSGDDFALPNLAGVRLVNLWSWGDHNFSANYINTLRNGARLLAEVAPGEGGIFVMDFVSPFSAGLGLAPPEGDSSWQHIGRTFNHEHFLPPEELFEGVRIVMEPKYPVERWTYSGLRDRYLPYVHANYELIGENIDWWVFRRKDAPDG